MPLQKYIDQMSKAHKSGNSTENTYRPALKTLLEELNSGITATNEPQRIECGAPDFIITKKDIPLGYIEAKDIGVDLDKADKSEQLSRYKSLDNLILTDYLNFIFYRNGNEIARIKLASIEGGKIAPSPDNFDEFERLIKDFCSYQGITINSSRELAKMMAGKAKIMAEVIAKALISDEKNYGNSTLKDQLDSFRKILIHDIEPKEFADVYAQTIAYGMFAARLYDPDLETFSRREAAELIPKTNPFLRKFFGYIAGPDIDDRIKWVVDALADVFSYANLQALMKNYGKGTGKTDPAIHFYETFLSEYNPALRKARGVWYTPPSVVSFIVRAVDDILKTEFNLPMGLADTSKTALEYEKSGKETKEKVHKVQILDPAAGTGTFLAEVIKNIRQTFKGQEGMWSRYVDEHLIPRVHGFEILMASYAMAHLNLDITLKDTGYASEKQNRLQIYLTNSLEEAHPDMETSFTSWLSQEASEANSIKKDVPVMVVLGNPPYRGISSNNGEWITKKIENYKYIDGQYFGERKHWLQDDYVKFIRLGEHLIEKNSEGILAYINNHSFLDNPTFRGMRWHILNTFDKIYILDLHGNSNKKETAPDGSKDENVFNIQQGVSINLFVKTGAKKDKELAKVYHADVYGYRESKYEFCNSKDIKTAKFKEIKYSEPYYFFVPKDFSDQKEYETGFKINELFPINTTGVVTARDGFVIDIDKTALLKRIEAFTDNKLSDQEIRNTFFRNKKTGKYLRGDSRGWKLSEARQKIKGLKHEEIIKQISYRPFDIQYIYYCSSMVDWGREKIMQHFLLGENVGLAVPRQCVADWRHAFITKGITEFNLTGTAGRFGSGNIFPLYIYFQEGDIETQRKPNLNDEIIQKIASATDLIFTPEKTDKKNTFSPIDLLDYIYGVLHSPNYRQKYKEFLKIDFPRIPYPKDKKQFFTLAKMGAELRLIHLMEHPLANKLITKYPVSGSDEIAELKYQNGKVLINKTQYFDGVAENVWKFYIGGYQPAQKWLKDRKGKKLSFDDILHYQKIIAVLNQTIKLMAEIDKTTDIANE
ncbi:MAG: N-6 DNA methylase [Elusimicrobia bacterium]|nr:N-6 DNA methylase [Elusimicrobiota bacterium]